MAETVLVPVTDASHDVVSRGDKVELAMETGPRLGHRVPALCTEGREYSTGTFAMPDDFDAGVIRNEGGADQGHRVRGAAPRTRRSRQAHHGKVRVRGHCQAHCGIQDRDHGRRMGANGQARHRVLGRPACGRARTRSAAPRGRFHACGGDSCGQRTCETPQGRDKRSGVRRCLEGGKRQPSRQAVQRQSHARRLPDCSGYDPGTA